MNEYQFVDEVKKLGVDITSYNLELLRRYAQILIEKNKTTNLTRIDDFSDIYLKHFYDSLTLFKVYEFNDTSEVLDVGSGAGFPGIVLAIFFPKIKITLLDSNNKKTTFLKYVCNELNLKNVLVVNNRAEHFINNNRQKFDLVVARAVANLTTLSELCLPFVKINGYFIAMKANATLEIDDALYALNTLGGKIENIIVFNLPIINATRTLVSVIKKNDTPSIYPRRYDKILKNPLKK